MTTNTASETGKEQVTATPPEKKGMSGKIKALLIALPAFLGLSALLMQSFFAYQDNLLMAIQNVKMGAAANAATQQVDLLNANRTAMLTSELSATLDQMETAAKKGSLSDVLIGRIIGLSRSLKPYKLMNEKGEMAELVSSPERAQLLIPLLHASFKDRDLTALYKGADFSYADLSNIYLPEAYLQGANLANANLSRAYLAEADLSHANLSNSQLEGLNLTKADLTGANLSGVKSLNGVNLTGAKLDSLYFGEATWEGVNLSEVEIGLVGVADKQWLEKLAALSPPPAGLDSLVAVYQVDTTETIKNVLYADDETAYFTLIKK